MFKFKKAFIIGLVIGSLGFASLSTAGNFVQNITVNTKPITLKENGVEIQHDSINPKNSMYYNGRTWVPSAMIYEGTTYVPIRVVAESFGKDVVWESKTRSISFNDAHTVPRPTTKKIPVFVEGMTDMREAKLKNGNLNYDMYVLNNFSLEAEEPFRDVLLSNFDSSFFVRIEVLDQKVNMTNYKNDLKNSLDGKVHDLNPNQIFDSFFHNADFYLLQEAKNGNVNVSITHLVRDYGTKKLKFTIHIPAKEAAEGIGPSFWAMLKTIETK
ncbi:stalk domain-containing protein [Anaerobacillus sp. MEB173]|uniref:stalk domain-containing protein n=1 Tax=Anaerobacillus sp. MEB173 TaxID=3383345 RepID=UPI003F8E8A3E